MITEIREVSRSWSILSYMGGQYSLGFILSAMKNH